MRLTPAHNHQQRPSETPLPDTHQILTTPLPFQSSEHPLAPEVRGNCREESLPAVVC